MPRLRPLTKDEMPPRSRELLESVREPSPGAGIQARCPDVLEASRLLGSAPGRSGLLPAQLRALVQLRAAQMIRCPY